VPSSASPVIDTILEMSGLVNIFGATSVSNDCIVFCTILESKFILLLFAFYF
jgi:hypothetical protein